jgi:hypothetical protein
MKRASLLLGAAALGLLAGCGHGVSNYVPQLRAPGELTLHYDDGFSMTAEGKEVAHGYTWGGLTDYVKCVPKARQHAEAAESAGTAAATLSWLGAGIGLASLGSLASLSLADSKSKADQQIMGYALLAGLGGAVTGVILAAIGRHEKPVANGHALDAMNYYNDEVGSRGGTCEKPPAKLPEVEPLPKPAKPAGSGAPSDTPAPEDKPSPSDKPKPQETPKPSPSIDI